jgi:hypothetical protein
MYTIKNMNEPKWSQLLSPEKGRIKGIFIPVLGPIVEVYIKRKDSLDEFRKLVDGYIEAVSLDSADMYCNEEGRLMNLPLNFRATRLNLSRFSEHKGEASIGIVGDVLLLGSVDRFGYNTNLNTNKFYKWLKSQPEYKLKDFAIDPGYASMVHIHEQMEARFQKENWWDIS